MYVEVLIPLNLNSYFTYKATDLKLNLGSFVKVDFKGKILVGIVISFIENTTNINYKVKEIESLIQINPVSKSYIDFLNWISDYNIVPIGLVLKSGLIKELESPRYFELRKATERIKNKTYKKVLDLFKTKPRLSIHDLIDAKIRKATLDKMLDENILSEIDEKYIPVALKLNLKQILLSDEQQNIRNNIKLLGFYTYLLDGVTGSGKTSIYLSAIVDILNNDSNSQALIMLPEISLSMYISSRIKSHFDDNSVVEWHSKLSPNKRISNWHKIVSGQAKVIVSARSGIFLPIPNLKIIVVDEEHDGSFKQDQGHFVYNARDLAIVRAKFLNIPIILSSATPSLESIYNIEHKNYVHLQLKKRFGGAQMPEISIVDMCKVDKITKYISNDLYLKVKENFQQKKQSLIFLNRRGYSSLLLCPDCGYRIKCQNCSSWMVQHKRKKILLCHLCGFEMQIPKICVNCDSEKLISFGPGVEKIEEEIKKLFPEQKILVISSDNQKIEDFQLIEENKIDIIIGTQIISKGYDFSNLSLLAIIDSDANVHGGDLRSSEKNFQILQQVIGRVGRRKEIKGNVVLQTYSPDSFMIRSLKNYDRDLFYKSELDSRKSEFMPPFSKLVAVIISGYLINEVLTAVKVLQKNIVKDINVQVFGPAPAPIEVLNNRYRYRFLLIYKKTFKIQNYIKNWLSPFKSFKKIDIIIDVDPINFL